jgi:trehalose 6-phosphate phosphatase
LVLVSSCPAGDQVDRAGLWRSTAALADRCAFFFDFDGTLAPIQDDPEAVRPVPGALDALGALAGAVGLVALVSARPASFLRDRLAGLPEVAVFGLYGLESQIGTGPVRTHPDAVPYQQGMRELADAASAELPAGIMVEYKRLSVALHYRTAPHLRPAVEGWAAATATRLGLRAQAGRMVIELKPPGDRDKGSVVAEQIADLACAWYFGDDLSDLRAFAALDARHRQDPSFVGVRVAVANPESGDALGPAADLSVEGPEQVPALITDLLRAMPRQGR